MFCLSCRVIKIPSNFNPPFPFSVVSSITYQWKDYVYFMLPISTLQTRFWLVNVTPVNVIPHSVFTDGVHSLQQVFLNRSTQPYWIVICIVMNYICSMLMGCYARIQYVYYLDGLLGSYSIHVLFWWAVMVGFNTWTTLIGCYARIQYIHDVMGCYAHIQYMHYFDGLLCSYSIHVATILLTVMYYWCVQSYGGCYALGTCVIHQTVCYPSAVSCDLSVGAVMLSVLCHTPNGLLP